MVSERFAKKYDRWKSALLDLTGRNRLLRHRASRSASLQIVRPGASELFKRLVIEEKSWRLCLKDPDEGKKKARAKAGKKKKSKKKGKKAAAAEAPDVTVDADAPTPDDASDADGESKASTTDAPNADPDAPDNAIPEDPDFTPDEKIPLSADEFLTWKRGKKAERCATHLMRSLRAGREEQGTHVLYLAFGMLRWTEEDKARDKDWCAPLIVVPVNLTRKTMRDPFRISHAEDEPEINPALIEKLRIGFNISLPPMPEELEEFDPVAWAAEVAELVQPLSGFEVIANEVWLDRFDFTKIAMYQDLVHFPVSYEQHPVVRALAGETDDIPHPPDGIPLAADLDEKVPINEMWHVLDADSSQQEAVEIVKRGGNLVLEGPPGTGKSQTITNMIAELIAAGKRVLFVSEKRAALEVVWRRLHAVGLGDYALDLHNPRLVNKKTVAIDLYNAWRGIRRTPGAPFVDFNQVQTYRDRLNRYVDALHEPVGGLGLSPWQGYQRYWNVIDAPDLRYPMGQPLDLTPDRLRAMDEGVERLTNHLDVLRNPKAHPWSFVDHVDTSLKFREAVEDELRDAVWGIKTVMDWCRGVAGELGIDSPATLSEADLLITLVTKMTDWPGDPPLRSWFFQDNLADSLALAKDGAIKGPRLLRNQADIGARYHERFVERADLEGLLARARQRSDSWFHKVMRNVVPFFYGSFWQDVQKFREYLEPEVPCEPKRFAADCLTAIDIREDSRWFTNHRVQLMAALDSWFIGPETDWAATVAALEWVAARKREFHERVTESMLEQLIEATRREHWKQTAADGRKRVAIARAKLQKVLERFPRLDTASSPLAEATHSMTVLHDWFQYRLREFDQLHEWMAWLRAEEFLVDHGFRQIINVLEGTKLPAERIRPAVQKRFWRLWIDAAQLGIRELNGFRGDDHENLIQRFRNLDKLVPQTGATRIAQHIEASRPGWSGFTPEGSEPQILTHQASLKRGHLSVRRLLERIPRLALRLKPCWMMSPLSVCHYLGDEHRFDVVIFDEASQVRPEDAIPSIRRGEQVVIVGDRQQLPPTTFFEQAANELEEVDEDDIDLIPLESVLEEAARFFPVRRLSWHYRSRDEALIAYSNRVFYDDQLITFPAPRVPGLDSQRSGNTRRLTREAIEARKKTGTLRRDTAAHRAITGEIPTASGSGSDTDIDTAELVREGQLETAELVSSPGGQTPNAFALAGGTGPVRPNEANDGNGTGSSDDPLAIAPDAQVANMSLGPDDPLPDPPLGVVHIRVPKEKSEYEKGRNPFEAEVVVDRVVQIAKKYPQYSIGVVAFGMSQAQLIEDLLDKERANDPELDHRFSTDLEEPIFVKNLETVQGDERDIIIFSVTYGYEADGNLRLNFGPIQHHGGERRLNVAFTRSRFQVLLISSLGSHDIDPERARSEGARRLREYLAYAEQGGRFPDHHDKAVGHNLNGDGSGMVSELKRSLELHGYRVHRRVGQGQLRLDLAIVHPNYPGQYALGIETDGPTYAACSTCRDRDRTRPAMLAHLGWDVARVWSRDRFERPDEVVEDLVQRIERNATRAMLLPRPDGLKPVQAELKETTHVADPAAQAAADLEEMEGRRKMFAVYRHAQLEKPAGDSPADAPEDDLVTLIQKLVEVEGPVHHEVIYDRFKGLWEFKVRSRKITDAIDAALARAVDHGYARRVGDFYWPPGKTAVKARMPEPDAEPRDIQHICVDELESLFVEILQASLSLGRDDLLDSASKSLGYSQLSSKRRSRLASVLNGLLTNQRLIERDAVITIPTDDRG